MCCFALTALQGACRQFYCGSKELADLLVCGFSALRAEKPHTLENKVPLCRRRRNANYVSPDSYDSVK
jgi:hypothetical protein